MEVSRAPPASVPSLRIETSSFPTSVLNCDRRGLFARTLGRACPIGRSVCRRPVGMPDRRVGLPDRRGRLARSASRPSGRRVGLARSARRPVAIVEDGLPDRRVGLCDRRVGLPDRGRLRDDEAGLFRSGSRFARRPVGLCAGESALPDRGRWCVTARSALPDRPVGLCDRRVGHARPRSWRDDEGARSSFLRDDARLGVAERASVAAQRNRGKESASVAARQALRLCPPGGGAPRAPGARAPLPLPIVSGASTSARGKATDRCAIPSTSKLPGVRPRRCIVLRRGLKHDRRLLGGWVQAPATRGVPPSRHGGPPSRSGATRTSALAEGQPRGRGWSGPAPSGESSAPAVSTTTQAASTALTQARMGEAGWSPPPAGPRGGGR